MADLVNLLRHMAGKSVLVNGTVYQIDPEGVVTDVADTDAAKLLQNKAWMEYDPEAEAKREERRKVLREQYKQEKGGIQLLTREGELIDPHAVNKAQEKAERTKDYPSMRSEPGSPEVDAGVPAEEPVAPEIEAATHEEKGTLGGDYEWPDPDMSMKKAYLQDMAHAYGVKFNAQTKKQELVSKIMVAMYDET